MQQDRMEVKKTSNRAWGKLLLGSGLCLAGMIFIFLYIQSEMNIMLGILAMIMLAPGALLSYYGLKAGESGFKFTGKRMYTGKENCLVWYARGDKLKDIPLMLDIIELKQPPKYSRLHYVKPFKRHFHELFNNTVTQKLEPFILPDSRFMAPEVYKTVANMDRCKDYMDYTPPTMLVKVAPWVLLLAIIIVGILMIATGPQPTPGR